MPKFIAIGTHPPVTPEPLAAEDLHDAVEGARQNTDWYQARLDDGTFEQVYVMEGVGRLVVAESESEEALRAMLRSVPSDHPLRQWEVNKLLDFHAVVDAYLESLGG